VAPRSRAEGIEPDSGVLRVRLTAPAVEGKANAALVRLLAKALGVPRSAITIAHGEHGRDKIIFVEAEDLPEPYLSLAQRGN